MLSDSKILLVHSANALLNEEVPLLDTEYLTQFNLALQNCNDHVVFLLFCPDSVFNQLLDLLPYKVHFSVVVWTNQLLLDDVVWIDNFNLQQVLSLLGKG